jgi:hypothetical protein
VRTERISRVFRVLRRHEGGPFGPPNTAT